MKYAKYAVAAALAALAQLGVALTDDTVTVAEWVSVAVAGLAAVGLYWKMPPEGGEGV
jgi:hypothetical protein